MSPAKFMPIAITAGATTTIKILCYIFESATHEDIVPRNLEAIISLAVSIAWAGLFTAIIVNRLDVQTQTILTRIGEAVEEAGDRRAIQATVDALSESGGRTPLSRRPTLV